MLKIWNAANFRRTVTAISLVIAPVLFAATEFLSAPGTDSNDPMDLLTQMAQHHNQLLQGAVIGSITAILFIPALMGLIHVLSGRGIVLGHLGGGLALLGNAIVLILNGANFGLWAMTAPGIDLTTMVPAVNAMSASPILNALFMSHWFFALGFILLGIGLWQSRAVPRFSGVFIVLAVLVDFIFGTIFGDAILVSILSNALMIIGFGGVAWSLLATSDTLWEKMVSSEGEQPMTHKTAVEAV